MIIGDLVAYRNLVVEFFQPLLEVVHDREKAEQLMHQLGYKPPREVLFFEQFADMTDAAFDVIDLIDDAIDEEHAIEDVVPQVASLLVAIKGVVAGINNIKDGVRAEFDGTDFLTETDIQESLARKLFDFLFVRYLEVNNPTLLLTGRILGIIELELIQTPETPFKVPYQKTVVHWDRIGPILSDPITSIISNFSANDEIQYDSLIFLLENFGESLGLLSDVVDTDVTVLENLSNGVDVNGLDDLDDIRTLEFPLLPVPEPGPVLHICPLLDAATKKPVGICGAIDLGSELDIPLEDGGNVRVEAGGDFADGLGFQLKPGGVLDFIGRVFGQNSQVLDHDAIVQAIVRFFPAEEPREVGVSKDGSETERFFSIGDLSGNRLEVGSVGFAIGAQKMNTNRVFVEANLNDVAVMLATDDADSFVSRLTSGNKLQACFDIIAGFASDDGFYFRGSSGLDLRLPTHTELGPIKVTSIVFGVGFDDGSIPITAAATISAKLGPLSVLVEDIGLKAKLDFPADRDGRFGPLDIDLSFKPPEGVGLVIDGGGFKGGGSLRFEPDEQRYVGFLELEFKGKIAIKALGLLTTRPPDGSKGFSLLIIITAEFTPIQLGFGFTLNGIGGLLGLNRTAKVERLRTGVKDNTLSSILFPQNIVANANRIISDLRQVFPPQADRFIFGPMAKIGWGSPTLITIDLGLMIEVPNPVRLLILGVLRAQIPNEEERKKKEEVEGREIPRILQLQINFLGEINFEEEWLTFDAILYDSQLLSFTLSGNMAVRLSWGSEPNFLLTVGGFHPAYNPPAVPVALPNLQRLTLSLLSGNNPRLTLETYFAVTSNTVQFGAKLELYAVKYKFNVYGFLSFDALFQFSPFLFIADIGAMLALRIGSSNIASINVSLTLSGPTPWHARGTAKLKICWFFTLKVRFNKTFGEERDTRLDDVPVLPLLQAALSNTGNWEVQIPRGRHALVSVKEIAVSGDEVVANPAGVIRISQKVVPLNVTIEKFGHQQPSDGNHFAIEHVRVGPINETDLEVMELLSIAAVHEHFAPAQFFEQSDTEKLSSRSFEYYDSGVKLTESEELATDYAARRPVEYEVCYPHEQRHRGLRRRPDRRPPDFAGFNAGTSQGAIAESPLSFANKAKSALAPSAVRFSQEQFVVVSAIDLLPVTEEAVAASEAGAYSLMNEMIRNNPAREGALQVVPTFEVNRS